MKSSLRAGAWGAWARAGCNVLQAGYIAVASQVISESDRYNPSALKAHTTLLYLEPVIMVGMSLGLLLAVWALFDLMYTSAPIAMRLSLATASVCAAALFFVAANSIARFDSLFLIEAYTPDQQGFALRILDMIAVLLGHVMVITQALSTLLWAYAGLRSGILSKPLSLAGLIIGAVALLFEFTPVNLLGFLLHVPLFIWLGVTLWRTVPAPAPTSSRSLSHDVSY